MNSKTTVFEDFGTTLCSTAIPSPWEIQDHLGTCRGDEVARSAEEAIAKYAVKLDISSNDISHWRAVRRTPNGS